MSTATLDQAKHILNLFGQKEVSKERLVAIINSGLLADLLDADPTNINRGDFRKFLGLAPVELRALVNRSLSLKEMIAAGHYDWVNDDITAKRFPIEGSGSVETKFKLVHFNRDIESDDAVKELDKRGPRPADLAEILAFGAAFPEDQRKYPIVELGSVAKVSGRRCVAYLGGSVSERHLDLYRRDAYWDAGCRFLAVCK